MAVASKPKLLDPWVAPRFVKADIAAMQALSRGEATPEQQKRAINYIVVDLSGINKLSFHPASDGGRGTAFAQGRWFIGNNIIEMTKILLSGMEDDSK